MYKLHRIQQNNYATYGVLCSPEHPLCVTLEDPWKDNKKNESCIPDGVYRVTKFSGPKYKDVWEVKNVPNRTAILLHWGNWPKDTQGCILCGEGFGDRMITNSKAEVERLRHDLPDEFLLHIKTVKG